MIEKLTRTRIALIVLIAAALWLGRPAPAAAFNDEYVYILTKNVADSQMHPVLQASLFPFTVILDTAMLPFSLIAGAVT